MHPGYRRVRRDAPVNLAAGVGLGQHRRQHAVPGAVEREPVMPLPHRLPRPRCPRGQQAMVDRSSRPRRSPTQVRRPVVRRILHLRRRRTWGPARIAHRLGLHASTVHRVLRREGMPRLTEIDLATRRRLRGEVVRYERGRPGELVHVDIKKLVRIPAGGGHRALGRKRGTRHSRAAAARAGSGPVSGYGYVHTALDDHSRLAYSEVLADETAATTVAWWQRAIAWFAGHGIRIERVLTDNGSCYRSRAWVDTCRGHKITAKRTRPYRPQTNDKVERYHRTLLVEWAYARVYTSDAARTAALRKWLHFYNHHRTHTALGGLPPA
ncbi:MAG: IS481 family transposase, partial [Mycobacterium leprae]